MQRNMNRYGGVVFSQKVLLALVEKGLSREEAYATVQSCAHTAWNTSTGDFHALIAENSTVTAHLSTEEIEACFDPQQHLKHMDTIYQRLNI
jgi:adenylosuccinate lyase